MIIKQSVNAVFIPNLVMSINTRISFSSSLNFIKHAPVIAAIANASINDFYAPIFYATIPANIADSKSPMLAKITF